MSSATRTAARGRAGDLRDHRRPRRVMTFHSLYRLETRGLLDCPIVGVAFDDWTLDHLAARPRLDRRRPARPRRGGLRALRRPALVRPRRLLGDAATYSASATRIGTSRAAGLLPRDPAVPLRHGREGPARRRPDEERPRRGREAVRPRPRLGHGARRRAAPVPRRVADLPHRPLPREDGPRGAAVTCASRTRCSSRSGTGTTSSASRSRWSRTSASRTAATSTTRSARCATWSSTTSCRWSRRRPRWSRRPAATPTRSRTRCSPSSARCRRRDPAHYVRGQYDGYRSIDGVAPDSTTETYAALRLEIDNWRWSGVPFFIRTGKLLPATQTEVRLVFKQPPRLGFKRIDRRHGAEPARGEARPVDRRPDRARRPPGRRRPGRSRSTLDIEFAAEGGEGATPYEVLLHAAMVGDSTRFTTPGRRRGDVADHAAAARLAAARAPVRARARGARRRRTSSSPATATGTGRGWRS